MNPIHRLRFWVLVLAALGPAGTARAQHVVYAEDGENFVLVRAAQGMAPLIDQHGKLERAHGQSLAMREVPEFAPYYIAIRDMHVGTSYMTMAGSGGEINNDFHLQGKFVSPYSLHHVFMLLDLKTDRAGKNYFLWEIGDLVANEPKFIELTIPLSFSIGEGKYVLHLFVDGAEVFNSRMPFNQVEQALDQMVRRRIKDIDQAPPHPFVGPAPEFPSKFRGKHVKGDAVVEFRISPTGRVHDPTVTSASDPAFGEAAVNAIRQWRFLPKIVGGAPVATTVKLPFVFSPQ